MKRWVLGLSVFMLLGNTYAWNLFGHQVVAQIAYDHLTPDAKKFCQQHLNTTPESLNASFLAASTWLDLIKLKNIHTYDKLHYMDIPFSEGKQPLLSPRDENAVKGIHRAVDVLMSSKESQKNQKLALLILVHLIGDIHQPLHAATKVSKRLPKGDLGGNLLILGKNSVGRNLHQYWDNGAGFFKSASKMALVQNKALKVEQEWACSSFQELSDAPITWANASHRLAVSHAYRIKAQKTPSKKYQMKAQTIVKKQAALAGCRLAFVLNQLAISNS